MSSTDCLTGWLPRYVEELKTEHKGDDPLEIDYDEMEPKRDDRDASSDASR